MSSLRFEEYTLDRTLRQLRRGEVVVPLPGKAFDLLAYMATNAGRPLGKSELLGAVWPDSFVEESNLSQNVFLLRKALGADGPIVTLPGRGYQFAAKVTELAGVEAAGSMSLAAAAGVAEVTEIEATHSRLVYEEHTEERIAFWRSPVAVGAAAVGVAAMVAAGWLGWQRYEDRVGGPPLQVVLADMDGGTGDPVLDRTLKDVLRIELSQSPFVTVVPGSTARQMLVQMMHKADDPIPASVAREVCERTGSQATVQGSVAHVGKGFVITEEATNCTDGASLGAVEETVEKPEELPRAIEKLAGSLRHSLGESRRTIARFHGPLASVSTSSLEALKDFSQATDLSRHGHYAESIELLKQAVQLDPQFAAAYLDLSSFSDDRLDRDAAKRYLQKAYEVRDHGTEPIRLLIVARYNGLVTGDLYESERNYKAWIAAYPRQVLPWSGLTEVYRQLGRAPEGIATAKRTLELSPTQGVVYQALGDAQMRDGDFEGCRATLMLALSRGFDTENIRYSLLRLGYAEHDAPLMAEQEAWLKTHPDSPVLLANMVLFAQVHGQFAEAERLSVQMEEAFARVGAPGTGEHLHQAIALGYLELGETELARKVLHESPEIGAEFDNLVALVDLGDTQGAEQVLRQQLSERPKDTLWHQYYEPLLRAEEALQGGRPQDALANLERARSFEYRSADYMYLRGKAYLQEGQLAQAEAEFRRLLAHPGIEPGTHQMPMAQIYLARVLAKEGNAAGAREAYGAFLEDWKSADAGAAMLKQVKTELATVEVKAGAREAAGLSAAAQGARLRSR